MREKIEMTDNIVDKVAGELYGATSANELPHQTMAVRRYWNDYTVEALETYNDIVDVLDWLEERDG